MLSRRALEVQLKHACMDVNIVQNQYESCLNLFTMLL